MIRCSDKAYAMCPDRNLCGQSEDAAFADGSDCAKFNREVEDKPMTNADRFRAMSDEEQQKCVRRFWEIEDFADWLQQPARIA